MAHALHLQTTHLSPFIMLSPLFALAALAVRVSAAQCDLSFATVSVSTLWSRISSQQHQIHLVSSTHDTMYLPSNLLTNVADDGSTPEANFIGGCTFGYFGAGCTWERQVSSPLDGYTIGHSTLSAFGIPGGPAPVNVTGNGCDGTILTCVGDGPVGVPIQGPEGEASP